MLFSAIILGQIGVAWLFIRWLIQQDRGPKEPKKILFLAGVFGALATIGSLFLEKWFVSDALLTNPHKLTTPALLLNCLLVGVIEEGLKAGPLALFIYRKGYFNEMTDGVIYFGISGMLFGVIEDIGYALSLGPVAGIAKVITGPYIHAGFCMLIGWTLASRKVQRKPWIIVLGGVIAAIGFHGLYDFGLFKGSGWTILMSLCITVFINVNVLLLLRSAQRSDVRMGLASTGSNYYCRNCGYPNPNRYVFCTNCGHKA